MDRIDFLYEKATLKRMMKDGRIDRAEYSRRLVDLIHRSAGINQDWEQHVTSALEVVK